MVTNDIALDLRGIGRFLASGHLAMIAIMFVGMGHNQRMMIAIHMVVRP